MGIERIPLEELEKMKKKRIKNLRKKGRAGQHEDFLYEQEVTPAEKKRYKAAVKMGDTEYKLGTKGYPKPKGPKFGAQPFKKSDGGILEKFKAFLASGEKPKGQIGKGSADTITGKIRVRKSVKEKEAEARKKGQIKKVNGKTQRYSDFATKKNIATGTVFTGEPRTIAEAKKRGSKTFINKKGKKLAAVTKEELAKSGLTLRQYLNKQQGKTAVGSKTTKAKKKVDKEAVRKKLGIGSNIAAGGSDLYMGLKSGGMGNLKPVPAGKKGKGLRKLPKPVRNKMGYMSGGGVANGYGRAAMRPGKDPRTISKT